MNFILYFIQQAKLACSKILRNFGKMVSISFNS